MSTSVFWQQGIRHNKLDFLKKIILTNDYINVSQNKITNVKDPNYVWIYYPRHP